ncbi:MAG: hypothetical protein AAB263_11085, partial [Planctomycetota bacterium]
GVKRRSAMTEERQKVQVQRREKLTDVHEAISAGDYAAFKELVGENAHFSSITEAQFPKLREMVTHLESARVLADELGLKVPKAMMLHAK